MASSRDVENTMQPWMSSANAPKLSGPDSITVRNIWVLNAGNSKGKTCSELWDVAIFIACKR